MSVRWRGIFPVLVSPFEEDGCLDRGQMVAQVRFSLDAGVDGLVYPGVASEFFTLSRDEVREALDAILQEVNGRVPVIAGISAPSTELAVLLAQTAEEAGASGVMCMLPYVGHFFAPDFEYALRHFSAVAESCKLPIVLQNARIGYSLSLADVHRLVERVPSIRYLKEETTPNTHRLSEAINLLGDRLEGVFGGIGSAYLLSELSRGATGSMPSPALVDRIVEAYGLWQEGERRECEALVDALAPLFTYELLYNISFMKEVLRLRGVLRSVATRVPAPRLDEVDRAELERMLNAVLKERPRAERLQAAE